VPWWRGAAEGGEETTGDGGELQWLQLFQHRRGERRAWSGAGHHFEKRRVGGMVDSASLGTEESAGGIGAVATPTEGGGGCNCSGKKKVKAVGERAKIGPKAKWAGHARPKRKLGQR
jgi:hypothetical protein